MKSRRAARKPPHSNSVTLADDSSIITDWRVRMLERLGTIERAWLLYGEAALLPPSPPGPTECPPRCDYCSGRWAA